MMKKIDMILKKAALFERLSLYDERKDFLKSAQSTQSVFMVDEYGNTGPVTALDFLYKFKELVQYAQSILSLVPQDQKNSQEAMRASSILKDPNIDIEKLKEAIDNLSRIVPSYKNSLMKKYNLLKLMSNSTLPKSTQQTTEQAAGAPAPAPKPAQSIDALFNFYYAKLQEAQKSSDSKTAQSFVPKMERVITRLDDMSAKLVISNPRENTRLSQLADKGRYLVQQVRNQFNMTQNPPNTWLETSAMRRVLAESKKTSSDPYSADANLKTKPKIMSFQQNILNYTERDPNFKKTLSDKLNGREWSESDVDGILGPRTRTAWNLYQQYATKSNPEEALIQQNKQNINTDRIAAAKLINFRDKLNRMYNAIAADTYMFKSKKNISKSEVLMLWLPYFQPEYGDLYTMNNNGQLIGDLYKEYMSLINYMQEVASGYMTQPGPPPESLLNK